ncbi:hypothetical protein O6H91_06G055400 [Diphasiastrum complanatum]|uniref:Uncharacterized protein n=1 Tax=Diphasiastrum complanatum TaxID=34168 RepID=A0ACC2DDV5_DIPCM|nr:hypothetical protein O6H91_06G055400 [Diphasiastrum complanatum]
MVEGESGHEGQETNGPIGDRVTESQPNISTENSQREDSLLSCQLAFAVDLKNPQQMRCVICHLDTKQLSAHNTSQSRKGKEHGTTAMKKHVSSEHAEVLSKYKAQKDSICPKEDARHPTKKRNLPSSSAITSFYGSSTPYKKEDDQQQCFLEDLVLYIVKGYRPLSSVENIWLRRLILRQCNRLVFPSRHQLVEEAISQMVAKTLERYVLPLLASCVTATASFDLWMSRGGIDTFALVINFLNDSWVPCHVTVGLFETLDTSGAAMALQLKELLSQYNLTSRIIGYVKDEGANLNMMTNALIFVVDCEPLNLCEPYAGTCFGHVMSKCCQYATNDAKVCAGMKSMISLKEAQSSLQQTITWTKKSRKGRQEWTKACIDSGLRPQKLKTPIKTRFASKGSIITCYSRQSLALQSRVPSPQIWAIAGAVSSTLIPVVKRCVLNQTRGYWLLSDALVAALKLCMQMGQASYIIHNSMVADCNGDFDAELELLNAHMKNEMVGVLEPFLSCLVSFSARKAHNILALMLDPHFKGLSLVRDYVGRDAAIQIVGEYDVKVLIPLLVTCFNRLNPRAQTTQPLEHDVADSLFGHQASDEEATTSLVKSELSLFRRLNIPLEECSSPLQWWKDHEVQFPNVVCEVLM